jgi:hypothetical protein
MFVSGVPDRVEPEAPAFGFLLRVGSLILPPRLVWGPPEVGPTINPGRPPWRIIGEHAACLQTVDEAAGRHGQTVKVVDVNQSGDDANLVQQYVHDEDILPILVRVGDRARIEGFESFSKSNVDRFVRGR